MGVEVRLYGVFTDRATDGEYDAETVGALLRELESRADGLDGRLLDESDSDLKDGVVVTVNKTDVQHFGGLDTVLDDGDVVRITKNPYPRR